MSEDELKQTAKELTEEEMEAIANISDGFHEERAIMMDVFNWSQGISFLIMLVTGIGLSLLLFPKQNLLYVSLFITIIFLAQVLTYTVYSKIVRRRAFNNYLYEYVWGIAMRKIDEETKKGEAVDEED